MYGPRIDEKLTPVIYRRAKSIKKPMTKVVNEILTAELIQNFYCRNCNNTISADQGSKEGYCDKCNSSVFLLTTSQ
jgi:Zn finger protein HypA/HybF involved in hydrogenase expression